MSDPESEFYKEARELEAEEASDYGYTPELDEDIEVEDEDGHEDASDVEDGSAAPKDYPEVDQQDDGREVE